MLKEKNQLRYASFDNNVGEIIPRFHFRVGAEKDVFNEATNKCSNIVISNATSEECANQIPDWRQKVAVPNDLMLLPIVVANKCIGFIYIDDIKSTATRGGLSYLDTLRNQVAMAIRQKSQH